MLKEDFRPSRVHEARELRERDRARSWRQADRPTRSCTCSPCAREAGTDLALDDFDTISARTPLLADMKPWGRFTAVDMDQAGGIMVVLQRLLEAGLLEEGRDDGHRPDASATRRAQRRRRRAKRSMRPLDNPLAKSGGMVILKGSLAPEGCVMKVAGHLMEARRFTARVFDREEDAFAAVVDGQDQGRRLRRHPLRGSEGRPGHARDARRHRRDRRRGARRRRSRSSPTVVSPARRTATWSGTSRPRPRSAVRSRRSDDGDTILIDPAKRRLDLDVADEELRRRLAAAKAPPHRYKTGAMAKYAKLVSSASSGAVTGE